MIKYLIEDLKLALNENIYTHEINKDKTEEIKENIEPDEKGKSNTSDTFKNIIDNSNNINPINLEKK